MKVASIGPLMPTDCPATNETGGWCLANFITQPSVRCRYYAGLTRDGGIICKFNEGTREAKGGS